MGQFVPLPPGGIGPLPYGGYIVGLILSIIFGAVASPWFFGVTAMILIIILIGDIRGAIRRRKERNTAQKMRQDVRWLEDKYKLYQ